MKRYSALVLILSLTVLMFSYCKSSKKAQAAKAPSLLRSPIKMDYIRLLWQTAVPAIFLKRAATKKHTITTKMLKPILTRSCAESSLIPQTKDLCLLGKISSTTAPLLSSSYGKSKVCLSNLASKEISEFRFAGAWFVG